jgi:hypothetical protein
LLRLADNPTSQHVDKGLTVPVSFNENGPLHHSASVSFFYVFETSGNDMIIGLPDIVRNFSNLFITMISDAVTENAVNHLK